jgi:hypothetical protein
MSNASKSIRRYFPPYKKHKPLPSGIFHYQAPPDAPLSYRLHLRLEPDGTGLLILNASTILHLNQTAAEFAYHFIMQTPEEEVAREVSARYRVNFMQANTDFREFKERIQTLISTPDLDPEMFLDFERTAPHSQKISAPYRLDCALTYRLPDEVFNGTFIHPKHINQELSTQDWYAIYDKAWSIGIPHIILTGGEPTLRDDLPDLIAHTETNGQVVGLLSDGLKLVDNSYLQTLLQTGLDHLMLLVNPDNENSWSALSNVLAADLFVAVHLTITLQNAVNTSQTIQRFSDMGVKAISLSASDHALHSSLIDFRNQAGSLGMSLVWDLPVPFSSFNPMALETQMEDTPPGAGRAWLYIEPDGDVLPAQGINQVLGNILKDPWETLWR